MKDYSLHSGERFPTLDLNLIGNDHLFRYEYVISKLGNSKNRLFGIDVFCGSGYGAALMSRKMNASIIAIDGSTEAIENARQKILAPNIIWASKQFPFELPKDVFDFVASMESIEHVKDHEAF
ncbi:class I SAM-dependent methyltransferase, partial [Delftia tsuruhatensis]|uniref:class I SAM-dependent methyltransferase n=1 Tax=Delftia tsuruhatensis TaxID=180282 RepID=UPI00128B1DF2